MLRVGFKNLMFVFLVASDFLTVSGIIDAVGVDGECFSVVKCDTYPATTGESAIIFFWTVRSGVFS